MKTQNKIILSVLLLTSMLFFFNACKSGEDPAEAKKVTILYPNWAEGIAFTNLAKVALEANGYTTDLINLEPGLIYGELSKTNSKGDVFLDAWLPNTHKDYWADYGDKLAKLGESFSSGTTGLVVPSYVTINSIEELNNHKDKFDGQIIGIGSGAGIHANTIKAIDAYDLDFEQITSSGPAMVASLEKAIKNNEWIIITGWKPHFKWAKNDLKYLEDPKNVYPADVCAIVARQDFEKDMPDVAKFFKNFNLKEDLLYSLMESIENKDELEGAKEFYQNNKTLVDGWFN